MNNSSLDDLLDSSSAGGAGRARRGRRRKESKYRSILPAIMVVIVLAGLTTAGYVGYSWVTTNLNFTQEPTDYEGPGGEAVTIRVNEGDTGTDIANTLVAEGVILTPGPFIQAFSANPNAAAITPGSYTLRKEMSSQAALSLLLDPSSAAGIRVTIPEGWRASQIFERLSEATGIPVAEFEAASVDYVALGVPENPAKSLEGYLWPGTYDFHDDETATQILTLMVERMHAELQAREIDVSQWHEILTVASIAEKEARTDEDFGKVVRTIRNRMDGVGEAQGRPMPLQVDSTIAYIFNLEVVSTTPEQRATDSPYNTYLYPGLPIGPIANPGAATIDAALNPPEGPWLYWVTVNTETGETVFTSTFEEHEKYVQQWREWARGR